MNTRTYHSLSSEEKDNLIEKLLDKLGLEIYDPYVHGDPGVELRDKEEE